MRTHFHWFLPAGGDGGDLQDGGTDVYFGPTPSLKHGALISDGNHARILAGRGVTSSAITSSEIDPAPTF